MAIDHEVLTLKEVSELLKIHKSTIYKMTREGRIPALDLAQSGGF